MEVFLEANAAEEDARRFDDDDDDDDDGDDIAAGGGVGSFAAPMTSMPFVPSRKRSTSTHSGSDGGRGGVEGFLDENARREASAAEGGSPFARAVPPPPPRRKRSISTHSGSDGGRGGVEGFLENLAAEERDRRIMDSDEEEIMQRAERSRGRRGRAAGRHDGGGWAQGPRRGSFGSDSTDDDVCAFVPNGALDGVVAMAAGGPLPLAVGSAAIDERVNAEVADPLHTRAHPMLEPPSRQILDPPSLQTPGASVEAEPASPPPLNLSHTPSHRMPPPPSSSLPPCSPPPSSHDDHPSAILPPPRPAELAARERLVERERQARLETERARLKRQIALNRRLREEEGLDFDAADAGRDDYVEGTAVKTDGSVVGTIGDDVLSDVAGGALPPEPGVASLGVNVASRPPEPRSAGVGAAPGVNAEEGGENLELGFAMERFLSDGVVVGVTARAPPGASLPGVVAAGGGESEEHESSHVSDSRHENGDLVAISPTAPALDATPPMSPAGVLLVGTSDSQGGNARRHGSSSSGSLPSDLVMSEQDLMIRDRAQAGSLATPMAEDVVVSPSAVLEGPAPGAAGPAVTEADSHTGSSIGVEHTASDSDLAVSLPSRSTASHRGTTASRAPSSEDGGLGAASPALTGRSGSDGGGGVGGGSFAGAGAALSGAGGPAHGATPRLARLTESDILEMAEIDYASIGNAPPHSVRADDDADDTDDALGLGSFSWRGGTGTAFSDMEGTRTTVQESVSATETSAGGDGSRTFSSVGRRSADEEGRDVIAAAAEDDMLLAAAVSPPASSTGEGLEGRAAEIDDMIEERLRRMDTVGGSNGRLNGGVVGGGGNNNDGRSGDSLGGMAVARALSPPTDDRLDGRSLSAGTASSGDGAVPLHRQLRPGVTTSGIATSDMALNPTPPLVSSPPSSPPPQPIQVEGFDYDKWTDAAPAQGHFSSSPTGSFPIGSTAASLSNAAAMPPAMGLDGPPPPAIDLVDVEMGMGIGAAALPPAEVVSGDEGMYHDYGSAADVEDGGSMARGVVEDRGPHLPYASLQAPMMDPAAAAGACTIDRLRIGPTGGSRVGGDIEGTGSSTTDVSISPGDAGVGVSGAPPSESDPLLGVPREVTLGNGHGAVAAGAGFSPREYSDEIFPAVAASTRRGVVDSVFSSVRSVSTNDIEADMDDSEKYLASGMFYRAYPERLTALLVTLVVEIPVLFMISGGSDRLCSLIGRRRYQLMMAFLPLSSAISGNCGLQASTLTTRAISHLHVTKSSYRRWLMNELGAAFHLGISMGAVLGIIAFYAGGLDAAFGVTIAVAQFVSVVTAGLTGTFAPLVFTFIFHRDSGKWSGPLETAIQDVVGSFAMVIMSYHLLTWLGPADVSTDDYCGGLS